MATPLMVSYRIIDAKGKSASVPFTLPPTLTLSQLQEWVTAFSALLDVVTEGVVQNAAMNYVFTLPQALKDAAVANSDVEEGANLSFQALNIKYTHGIWVPAWAQGAFSGADVNVEATGVGAFLDSIGAGLAVTGGTATQTDRYNNDLTGYLHGSKTFRK